MLIAITTDFNFTLLKGVWNIIITDTVSCLSNIHSPVRNQFLDQLEVFTARNKKTEASVVSRNRGLFFHIARILSEECSGIYSLHKSVFSIFSKQYLLLQISYVLNFLVYFLLSLLMYTCKTKCFYLK